MSYYHKSQKYQRAAQGRRPARKEKTPPPEPKPCVIMHVPSGVYMFYREDVKALEGRKDGGFTEFPSHVKARRAIWHTAQKMVLAYEMDGRDAANEFEIQDIEA